MTESERCTGCGPALAGIPSIPGDGGMKLAVRPSPRPCENLHAQLGTRCVAHIEVPVERVETLPVSLSIELPASSTPGAEKPARVFLLRCHQTHRVSWTVTKPYTGVKHQGVLGKYRTDALPGGFGLPVAAAERVAARPVVALCPAGTPVPALLQIGAQGWGTARRRPLGGAGRCDGLALLRR